MLHELTQCSKLENSNLEQERIHTIPKNGIFLNDAINETYGIRYLFTCFRFLFWCAILKQFS